MFCLFWIQLVEDLEDKSVPPLSYPELHFRCWFVGMTQASLANSCQQSLALQKSSPLGPPNAKLPSNHPPAEVTFDGTTHFVNASSMNEHYQCIHAPLVFVSWLQFQWCDAQTVDGIAVPFAQPALVQNCSNKDLASQSSTFPPSPKGQSATHSFKFQSQFDNECSLIWADSWTAPQL